MPGTGAETHVGVAGSLDDEASGDDEGLVLAALSDADAGSGTDAQLLIIEGTDAGSGTEYAVTEQFPADYESGTGAEGPAVAGVSSLDTGAGTEFQWWEPPGVFLIFSYDSGHCQEGDTEPAADSDSATGSESSVTSLAVQDASMRSVAAGVELQSVFIAYNVPFDSDAGAGQELWCTAADKYGTESLTAAEASGSFPFSDADTAAGSDSQPPLEVFPFPPASLFGPQGYLRLKPGGHGHVQAVWKPGTEEELVLREWPEFHPSQLEWAKGIFESEDIFLPSDSDSGTMTERTSPTATVTQYATGPVLACRVPGSGTDSTR